MLLTKRMADAVADRVYIYDKALVVLRKLKESGKEYSQSKRFAKALTGFDVAASCELCQAARHIRQDLETDSVFCEYCVWFIEQSNNKPFLKTGCIQRSNYHRLATGRYERYNIQEMINTLNERKKEILYRLDKGGWKLVNK